MFSVLVNYPGKFEVSLVIIITIISGIEGDGNRLTRPVPARPPRPGFVNAISQAIATVNGVQTGDVAQSFSLHAVGSGNPLFINVNSNASSDVIADIIQVAGQTDINPDETGETSVVTTDTTTHTEVKPESQFNANVDGASEVIMHLDNIAVSGGQIDAEVVQVADVDFVSQDDIEEASPVVLLVPS